MTNHMSLVIDGYNVLHVVGIVGRRSGPGELHGARLALLNFLAGSLEPEELARTTVVFDAHDTPPGLPRTVEHRGITVRFAVRYEDADSLIEELIRADSAPRRLVVVSSDHRLHRAAHRRRAKAVDSDVWYDQLAERRRQRHEAAVQGPAMPLVPLLDADVSYWLRQFGGESALEQWAEQEARSPSPAVSMPDLHEKAADNFNPFPPGYAEELEERG